MKDFCLDLVLCVTPSAEPLALAFARRHLGVMAVAAPLSHVEVTHLRVLELGVELPDLVRMTIRVGGIRVVEVQPQHQLLLPPHHQQVT